MSDPDLINTEEAAKIIGISRQSVVKAIKAGKITAYRVGHGFSVVRASAVLYSQQNNRQRQQTAKEER